ncbi:hypothetical protein K2173_007872 [Erythroxylum novogranatense]|uniref:Uncharacterized protein n=1 Tax=Erythroxylum novogranatense TaxID=1862640 RepID=A0AAV8T757_9ROSI|nr:hypothetical protein K2173_007872 [Erythroxylum novogranatense]
MAKLQRPNKELLVGGRSRPDGRCKKHTKHEQSPGVCSLCLKEKLSQLSTTASSRGSYAKRGYSLSSLSSYYSSCSDSSCSSPIHIYRYAPDGKGPSFSALFGGNALTKSRSLAFVSRIRGNNQRSGDGVKNKGGFFSKLLRPKQKRTDEGHLVRSRTIRER